jgi:predicted SAM-dependent methyltransferase
MGCPVTTTDARQSIEGYLRWTVQKQAQLRATKPTDSSLRSKLKHLVPPERRGTARMVLTNAVRTKERHKAEALQRNPLLLHLGSGGHHKDGWVNIDLVGDPVEVAWNLARPLPFEDGSVDGLFHEHLLEHLSLADGEHFMRECHRVLKPGAIARVGVPDAGRLIQSYAGDRTYLQDLHPDRPTAMLALQELFYWHRHCTMFDVETLALVFESAGFRDPVERSFGETALALVPDTERRRAETLYMEAAK